MRETPQKNKGGDLRQYALAKRQNGGNVMKKNNGYTINPDKNTITLTKAYAKLAYTPGTKEFREFSALTKAYPNLNIVMRTATINAEKEKHNGLTISRMEFIIKNYIGDEIGLAEIKEVQKFYKGMSGYYGKVKGWFLKKYPNYQEMIDFADIVTSTKTENNDLRIAG